MALQKEVWINTIQEQLFAGNEFVQKSVSHDAFVDNKTVHVPQAGTIPAVEKDRSTLPALISERTDTDSTYDLAEYTTDPILITDLDELQTSYAKRSSVLSHHTRKMADRIGVQALNDWSGADLVTTAGGQIVLMTGTASNRALPPGATGTRKAITLDDIGTAQKKLDEDEFPQEGRWMVMPAGVYWELVTTEDTLLRKDYMDVANLPSGAVNKILGFNIMVRSFTSVYADAATPTLKAVGAASAATDHWGCVAWQESAVAKAMGATKVFANLDKAEYYGSIFSALQMFASTKLRDDKKGIVTIVQDS